MWHSKYFKIFKEHRISDNWSSVTVNRSGQSRYALPAKSLRLETTQDLPSERHLHPALLDASTEYLSTLRGATHRNSELFGQKGAELAGAFWFFV